MGQAQAASLSIAMLSALSDTLVVHRAEALCKAQDGADAIAPIAAYGPTPPTPTPTLTND